MLEGTIAFVGGLVASTLGAWLAIVFGLRRLEEQEIRKLQVALLVDLYAVRAVGYTHASPELRRQQATAYNRVGILFGSSRSVMEAFRRQNLERTNEAYLAFIKEAAQVARVDITHLTRADSDYIITEYSPRQLATLEVDGRTPEN